ncbi:cupin domain-containing protein [bacterium SCSIO 12741]|nr:cupin domain-containing protein [bacterium SCSIO 12741]
MDAQYWIEKLALLPHPEGGHYRETFRSNEEIKQENLPQRYAGNRNFGTAIYYLLEGFDRSRFHVLKSDEIWYYHSGSSAIIHFLTPEGKYEDRHIGPNPERGEQFQVVIPRGTCFAVEVKDRSGYILVGCSVHPGFDFSDFSIPTKEFLHERYPAHRELVERLG